MNLSEYNGKYVRIHDINGVTFEGFAEYGNRKLPEKYGQNEDGIFVNGFPICSSRIGFIEVIEVHGTVELWTSNLILRRYFPDDAKQLYEHFGTDPEMHKYSGWNPYATQEMAQETVRGFIESYKGSCY